MKNITPRWLSWLGIAAVAVLLVACTGSSSKGGEGNGTSSTIDGTRSAADGYRTTVNVTMKDFSVVLDPSQPEAGRITFAVKNDGSVPHDFAIQGNGMEQKSPMLAAGETASLAVDLEPGTYTYICTIPGHEQLGMRGTFTVISP